MTLEDCRRFYSEEIQLCANITSTDLVEAFARVPRENFLDPGRGRSPLAIWESVARPMVKPTDGARKRDGEMRTRLLKS
jgi:hypothetical protein